MIVGYLTWSWYRLCCWSLCFSSRSTFLLKDRRGNINSWPSCQVHRFLKWTQSYRGYHENEANTFPLKRRKKIVKIFKTLYRFCFRLGEDRQPCKLLQVYILTIKCQFNFFLHSKKPFLFIVLFHFTYDHFHQGLVT